LPNKLETEVKTLILGVGNILLQDEGFGPSAIEILKKEGLPQHVELIDAGTQILEALLNYESIEKLIMIDAVKAGGIPGSIYRFRPEDIKEKAEVKLSLHQATALEALKMLEIQNKLPKEVVIFGIEPKDIKWGLELSAEMKETMPKLIKLITEEVLC